MTRARAFTAQTGRRVLFAALAFVMSLLIVVAAPLYSQESDAYAVSYSVASEYDGLPQSTITNCVAFARYKVPSLPSGMNSAAEMKSHINSHTPKAGAIAIYSYQHVSYVESVNGNTVVTLNGGFRQTENGPFTGHIERITGTPSELSIEGYWVPGGAVADTTPPTITNVKITNKTANGYTVTCTVKDNVGVTKCEFPTWKVSRTSAGCTWYKGTKSGDTYSFTFKDADLEGDYLTHIYAWDAAGNRTSVAAPVTKVIKDTTPPTITNVKVTNKNSKGYTVTCTVKDNVGVAKCEFPTWKSSRGSEGCTWYKGWKSGDTYGFTFSDADLEGDYRTHIYAWDTLGNRTSVAVPMVYVGKTDNASTGSTGSPDEGTEGTSTTAKAEQSLRVADASKTYGDDAFMLDAELVEGNGELTYSSSNPKIATVSSQGIVTIKRAGTAKITVSAAETAKYEAASEVATITVAKKSNVLTVKRVKKTHTVKYGVKKVFAASKVYKVKENESEGKITYKKIAGPKKVTVSKAGKVTVKKGLKKGTYTVKVRVTSAATKNYKAAKKTIAFKVKVKKASSGTAQSASLSAASLTAARVAL